MCVFLIIPDVCDRVKLMGKKSVFTLVVFLVLGVVVTYGVEVVEVLFGGNALSGAVGFPFKYGYSSFFGGSTVDYKILLIDVAFWCIVLWIIWKVLPKLLDR